MLLPREEGRLGQMGEDEVRKRQTIRRPDKIPRWPVLFLCKDSKTQWGRCRTERRATRLVREVFPSCLFPEMESLVGELELTQRAESLGRKTGDEILRICDPCRHVIHLTIGEDHGIRRPVQAVSGGPSCMQPAHASANPFAD